MHNLQHNDYQYIVKTKILPKLSFYVTLAFRTIRVKRRGKNRLT